MYGNSAGFTGHKVAAIHLSIHWWCDTIGNSLDFRKDESICSRENERDMIVDDILLTSDVNSNRKSILKIYYAKYLKDVRGLTDSSVNHYYDALNNISKRLKSKGLVKDDLYEIMDLDYLASVRDDLYNDPDFIELNERGRRMYSAGFNNYFKFASGEGFKSVADEIEKMDTPIIAETPSIVEQKVWKRSNILRVQVFSFADYKCEINGSHETFIAESSKKPYMEGHHAIPMRLQEKFHNSLDVYANIVCLCPICHRKIHYGLNDEKSTMLDKIYYDRADRLAESGLKISKDDFEKIAGLAK